MHASPTRDGMPPERATSPREATRSPVMATPFCRACSERLLGTAVIERARRVVDEAPTLTVEQEARVRALFQSARQGVARPPRWACEHKATHES